MTKTAPSPTYFPSIDILRGFAAVSIVVYHVIEHIFPVYFMRLLVIEMLKSGTPGFSITSFSIHPAFGIIALASYTFFMSLTITSMLKTIPSSKNIIG